MKPLMIALAIVLVADQLSFAAAPATQPTPPSSLEKENARLRERVAALEVDVQALEARVARQQRMIDSLSKTRVSVDPRGQTLVIPPLIRESPIPPGSVPQQFNGSTFYLVPLAEQQMRTQVAPALPVPPAPAVTPSK
jgi:hypothetical protein